MRKLMENTLVIFITDNGPNTGGYKKDERLTNSITPIFKGKVAV